MISDSAKSEAVSDSVKVSVVESPDRSASSESSSVIVIVGFVVSITSVELALSDDDAPGEVNML